MGVQLVVAMGNRAGQVIPIMGEKFIIGRAGDCHLKSQSELISRYHCAVLIGDGVVVRDLGSKNGVRLNGERINAEQKIRNGDKLGIGPLEFYVHITSDGNETAAKLPVDGRAGTDAAWGSQMDSQEASDSSAVTVLLDSLKSLHHEVTPETEQPIVGFLKKFH